MKQRLVLFSCALALSVAAPIASAAPDIPFFHHHKKDANTTTAAPKPKTKRSFLHRAEPTRQEAALAEATFGMPGPRSVGFFHPEPGPAGVGAR